MTADQKKMLDEIRKTITRVGNLSANNLSFIEWLSADGNRTLGAADRTELANIWKRCCG